MLLNNYDYEDETLQITTSEIDRKFWDYFDGATTASTNITETVLRDQGPVLVIYGILLAVGGVGNVAVLVSLARSRRRKSRVDLMMTHLALADVCVTCGVIPLEIGWKYTNAWLVGNLMCKLLLVLRAFGLYLSSNVLVCISVDRFFAVIYPLRLPVARRRSKQMLLCAWAFALACSLPQSVVFRVKRHPQVAGFEQCVSFGAFSSEQQEVVYNVFCLCAMYFLPLIVITVCYVCIFCEIHRSSKELDEKRMHRSSVGHVRLRRSDRRVLERARRRTLRMTVTIVAVFALCWLPYATITMWYMVDRESAAQVSPRVQDLLFVMAVSNSCMNPLVYGSYTLDIKGLLRRLLKKTCCHSSGASDTIGIDGSGSSSIKNRNVNLETPLMKSGNKVRTRLGVRFAETSLTAVPSRLEVPKVVRGPA
ncbi:adipokinetic hormone/corazonin-related peptide receptor variant I [Spodoptera frugiperda]|uniref:Adipokinetic hormone/corazonin-related peptide receptor variant I n=1 Tax=Spodoptera frugiperda TaxID=7108 RepID=A0A9R0ENJ0_SPOFR|nr:adipokinetic hormone/corazonin-related peptide receptor variant I [Spodoptera frugiperda]